MVGSYPGDYTILQLGEIANCLTAGFISNTASMLASQYISTHAQDIAMQIILTLPSTRGLWNHRYVQSLTLQQLPMSSGMI